MITLGEGTATSTAPPEAFFARWVDHDSWSTWSPDTAWVRLEGPPALGTRGRLKPKDGPQVRFVVSAFEPGHRYADTTRLPGARLVFDHTAVLQDDATRLAARATMVGPLAGIWAKIMSGGFQASVQADLDRLILVVESGLNSDGESADQPSPTSDGV
jgi:uncharacterized protein YndB with AHSA1/START domain